MLHEPEFESLNEEQDAEAAQEAPRRTGRKIFRIVFYSAVFALTGLAVGVQASPEFAATVGRNVPEPVAAAMATMTGTDLDAPLCATGGKCCASMSRAALMAGTEEGSSCCSSGSLCPMEQAALASAESGCCSSSEAAMLAATEESEGCSGACPLSGMASEDALASAEASEAISLAAPGDETETPVVAPANEDSPIEATLDSSVEAAEEAAPDAA